MEFKSRDDLLAMDHDERNAWCFDQTGEGWNGTDAEWIRYVNVDVDFSEE